MIVLGRKYKFTEIEKQRLAKNKHELSIVKYRNIDPPEVLDNIKNTICKNGCKIIILNTQVKVHDDIIKYLTNLKIQDSDVEILTIEHFLEKYLQKCYIPNDNISLDYLENIRSFSIWQLMQKRIIDYLAIVLLVLLTWPVLLYARYKIKKQSPGASMFKQLRVGLNNKEFKCIKFRSMRLDAEKDGAQFASHNDDRVFSWGETMRKTRIDEIPQIVNVLKGDMHFIGPRPERKHWINQFETEIPYYNERHIVRPGITGWAQVMYPYGANAEDAKQKLMYDLYYIKHWNIFLELKVVFKTIKVVLSKRGV